MARRRKLLTGYIVSDNHFCPRARHIAGERHQLFPGSHLLCLKSSFVPAVQGIKKRVASTRIFT